jgi:NRPS condensation-like uncharacterized protein
MRRESIPADPVTVAVAGLSEHCHSHLHASIDLAERLDPALLRRALVEVSRAVPELRGRFRSCFFRSRWDLEAEPSWRIDEHTVDEEAAAQEIERSFFAEAFVPEGELPLELIAVHLPDHGRLLLRVSHFLADGGGTKNLLYRIAAAYRALSADDGWTAPMEPKGSHPLPLLLAASRRVSSWSLLRGFWRDLRAQGGGPFLSPRMNEEIQGPDRFHFLHVPADRVSRLKAACADQRATINDLALYAFGEALLDCVEPEPGRNPLLGAMATADFRLQLPPQDDVANLSVIGPLRFGVAGSRRGRALFEAVVEETSSWKSGATGLLGALLSLIGAGIFPHAVTRRVFSLFVGRAVGRMRRGITLTNMGIIDESRLDFGSGPCLGARIIGPIGKPPQLISSLTGCRGGIDFSLTWREGTIDQRLVHDLMGEFDSSLRRLESRARRRGFDRVH